jgi:hypothetical protein
VPVKPPQKWKSSPLLTVGSSDPHIIMDVIHDWMNDDNSTYDPTVNFPTRNNSDTRWTSVKESDSDTEETTLAIRMQPPESSTRRDFRVMIMGGGSGTPSMAGSDAYSDGGRMFTTFAHDIPWGDEADWLGWEDQYSSGINPPWKGLKDDAHVISQLRIIEGIEGLAIVLRRDDANGSHHMLIGGDLADDGTGGYSTTLTASSYLAPLSGSMWGSILTGTASIMFGYSATAGRSKTHSLHGSSFTLAHRAPLTGSIANELRQGNAWTPINISLRTSTGIGLGMLRGIYIMSESTDGYLVDDQGAPACIIIGSTGLTSNDAIGFDCRG